jgi:hypothetical protein
VTHSIRVTLCLPGTLLCSLLLTGCESQQDLLDRQQKALTSLRSTVASVSQAWLDGHVSTTYARTALEDAALLLDKQQTKITASPDALADPAIASVSDSEHQLARQIALLRKALNESNADAVRQLKSTVDSQRPELP